MKIKNYNQDMMEQFAQSIAYEYNDKIYPTKKTISYIEHEGETHTHITLYEYPTQ